MKRLLDSAISQAFLGAAFAAVLLILAEPTYRMETNYHSVRTFDFSYTMRYGGGPTVITAVFIGILAYRLGHEYLSRASEVKDGANAMEMQSTPYSRATYVTVWKGEHFHDSCGIDTSQKPPLVFDLEERQRNFRRRMRSLEERYIDEQYRTVY